MLISIFNNNFAGEFGIVYKGYIIKSNGSIDDYLAVKTLKGIAT